MLETLLCAILLQNMWQIFVQKCVYYKIFILQNLIIKNILIKIRMDIVILILWVLQDQFILRNRTLVSLVLSEF